MEMTKLSSQARDLLTRIFEDVFPDFTCETVLQVLRQAVCGSNEYGASQSTVSELRRYIETVQKETKHDN